LPRIDTILGTSDPLAVFPETLPERGAVRALGEYRELYHYERDPEFQNFSLWNVRWAALVRTGRIWAGWRHGRDRIDFAQREVHEEEDVLDGERDVGHHALLLAARDERGDLRLLIGMSRPYEAGLELRGSGGLLESLRWRTWVRESRTDLRQTVRGTTFFFPFPYRDANAAIEARSRPIRGLRFRGGGEVQQVLGRKHRSDWYNVIDVMRLRAEVDVERTDDPRLDLRTFVGRTVLGAEMALGGTVYGRARDLRSYHGGTELGWRWGTRRERGEVRLALGGEGRWLHSNDPSFLDVWPFTVWDVFTATRYRLERLRQHWTAVYARGSWQGEFGRSIDLGLDARLEWWSSGGDLFWKKRVPVFPFFFFRFVHDRESLALDATNGLQADAFARFPIGPGTHLRLDARIVAPFGDREDGEPETGDGDGEPPIEASEKSERGGITLRAILTSAW
jgi:hypothetical protein